LWTARRDPDGDFWKDVERGPKGPIGGPHDGPILRARRRIRGRQRTGFGAARVSATGALEGSVRGLHRESDDDDEASTGTRSSSDPRRSSGDRARHVDARGVVGRVRSSTRSGECLIPALGRQLRRCECSGDGVCARCLLLSAGMNISRSCLSFACHPK
jgi:hypothetical protein